MAVAVIAANLSRGPIREPSDHCGFADPRLLDDFEAVAPAAALPRDKAPSNRRDERRPATARLNAPPPGILCGLPNSVVGDMTPTYGLQGDIQPQSRDLVLKQRLHRAPPHRRPMRAPLERLPVCLLETGLLGGGGAAHGYPD